MIPKRFITAGLEETLYLPNISDISIVGKSFFQTTKSENGTRTTMMFIASLSAARLMM